MRFHFKAATILFMMVVVSCSMFKPAFKGETVEPVAAAPEIRLPDQNGNPFQLSAQRGRLVLVFFGFTNCVEECPLTMAHLKQSLEILGDQAGDVQVVLVSTDPVRDTPSVLRDYLSKFNPAFLGVTGPFDSMSKIWSDYDVTVLDGGETHSSLTYVIDKQGNIRLHFDPDMSPENIAADLKILLAEK